MELFRSFCGHHIKIKQKLKKGHLPTKSISRKEPAVKFVDSCVAANFIVIQDKDNQSAIKLNEQ